MQTNDEIYLNGLECHAAALQKMLADFTQQAVKRFNMFKELLSERLLKGVYVGQPSRYDEAVTFRLPWLYDFPVVSVISTSDGLRLMCAEDTENLGEVHTPCTKLFDEVFIRKLCSAENLDALVNTYVNEERTLYEAVKQKALDTRLKEIKYHEEQLEKLRA